MFFKKFPRLTFCSLHLKMRLQKRVLVIPAALWGGASWWHPGALGQRWPRAPRCAPPVGAGWTPGGLPPSWGCSSAGSFCAHGRSLCPWDGHLQLGAGSGSLSIAPARGLDVAHSSECALFYMEMSPILASGGAAFLLLLGRGTQPGPASAAHLVECLQHWCSRDDSCGTSLRASSHLPV